MNLHEAIEGPIGMGRIDEIPGGWRLTAPDGTTQDVVDEAAEVLEVGFAISHFRQTGVLLRPLSE